MVHTSQTIVRDNTFRRLHQQQFDEKKCWFCGKPHQRASQSNYCSKYCNERASRKRKEAFVDALAVVIEQQYAPMTAAKYGYPIPLAEGQAQRMAAVVTKLYYRTLKYHVMALGWVYNETERKWLYQPRLHA